MDGHGVEDNETGRLGGFEEAVGKTRKSNSIAD